MNDTFLKAWKLLAASYPNAPHISNRETIMVYERALCDIPADALGAAVMKVVGASKFFPSVAEIRDAAFSAIERDSNMPTALEAWGAVCAAISAVGVYGTPRWKFPATEQAVRAVGGWLYICNSDNPAADRARFIEAYEGIVMRARADARQLPEVREAIQRLKANNRQQQVAGLIGGAVKKLEGDR